MSFAERVKSLRKQQRYSLDAFSKLIGVKGNTVWRWENERAKPDTETLIKIARALNTTAAYLLGEIDNPAPYALAENLRNNDIDFTEPISAGTAGDMLIIHNKNNNQEIYIPNNEEGRKLLIEILNGSLGAGTPAVSNSIHGDNNSGNNLGVVNH